MVELRISIPVVSLHSSSLQSHFSGFWDFTLLQQMKLTSEAKFALCRMGNKSQSVFGVPEEGLHQAQFAGPTNLPSIMGLINRGVASALEYAEAEVAENSSGTGSAGSPPLETLGHSKGPDPPESPLPHAK